MKKKIVFFEYTAFESLGPYAGLNRVSSDQLPARFSDIVSRDSYGRGPSDRTDFVLQQRERSIDIAWD
jgi:hypothetical protein